MKIEDVPPSVIHAVLAIEDRRFYKHAGVDPVGLIRAAFHNAKAGHVVQGGSTITQQLAKNMFLSHDRHLPRKIRELLLAFWLERELTKDEILSAYLNRVYFGAGAYGIHAASETYFGKSHKELSLYESATLAGLLKAPSYLNPLKHPKRAAKRTATVLNAMVDAGYIQESDKQKALSGKSMNVPLPPSPSQAHNTRYFTDYVLNNMEELTGQLPQETSIQTTLDARLQAHAERVLAKTLSSNRDRQVSQGAIIVLDYTGAIRTMVGGTQYEQSQFNRATQALRPPGSALKPFIVLTALQNGWSPDSQILDAPFVEGDYQPENYNDEYDGMISLRDMVVRSKNTAAVRLLKETGISKITRTLRNAGIEEKLPRDLSLALGSPGISLLSLTRAYQYIATDGTDLTPYAIRSIKTADGTLIYQHSDTPSQPVLAHRASKQIKSILADVIFTPEGTGKRAALPFPVAGKTGTSQDYRDAWFIGFSDLYVIGVWMGNDDNTPMNGVTGGSLPAEIWHDVMAKAHEIHDRGIDAYAKKGGAKPPQNTHYTPAKDDENFSDFLKRFISFSSPQ